MTLTLYKSYISTFFLLIEKFKHCCENKNNLMNLIPFHQVISSLNKIQNINNKNWYGFSMKKQNTWIYFIWFSYEWLVFTHISYYHTKFGGKFLKEKSKNYDLVWYDDGLWIFVVLIHFCICGPNLLLHLFQVWAQ